MVFDFPYGANSVALGEPYSLLIPLRNLTRNIEPKNHGPALQVRGTQCGGEFLGATDLGTRSVQDGISIQNHFFEGESVSRERRGAERRGRKREGIRSGQRFRKMNVSTPGSRYPEASKANACGQTHFLS